MGSPTYKRWESEDFADRWSIFRDMSGFFLLEIEQAQERAKYLKKGPSREQIEKVLRCAHAAGLAVEEWRKHPGEDEAIRAAKFLTTIPGVVFTTLGWYVNTSQKSWGARLEQISRDAMDLLADLASFSPYARPIFDEFDEDDWL
jgi:hypothetical protein